MINIPYAEFYITNVCNLSCPGCNRFNNYNFKGFQLWSDYDKIYEKWSKEVSINYIGILGGEPLLNPSIVDWITGIRKLWNVPVKIITNGFQLNKVKNFYDVLNEDKKIILYVGIHNKQHKKEIFEILQTFLKQPLTIKHNSDNKYQQFLNIVDANGVNVKLEFNWWFHQGSLIPINNGFTLHNSDPEKAHKNCHMKTCHHFIKGKLYKCGVVALLPEFDSQHKLFLSAEDENLMSNYIPLNYDDSVEVKRNFIKNLKNPIPQCKFCPEVYIGDQIFAIKKGH